MRRLSFRSKFVAKFALTVLASPALLPSGVNAQPISVGTQNGGSAEITPVRSFQETHAVNNVRPRALSPQEQSFRLNELGVKLILQGQRDVGERKFQEAIQIDPENTTALYNLAGLYLSAGKAAEAVQAMERANKIEPNDLGFLNRLAEAHVANDNTEKGVEAYERLVGIDPAYEQAMHRLGSLYAMQGRLELAESTLRKAAELKKNDAKVLSNLGSVLVMREKFEEAVKVLNEAQNGAQTAENEVALGIANEALGNLSVAVDHFKQARDLGATDPNIDRHIAELSNEKSSDKAADLTDSSATGSSPAKSANE